VICNHVLQYIPKIDEALVELRRILKPAGTLVVSQPFDDRAETRVAEQIPSENTYHTDHPYWILGHDFPSSLEAAGFQLQSVRPLELVDRESVRRHALLDSDIVFLVRRDE
jgi:hypothetical protein